MDIKFGKSEEISWFWEMMGPLFASREMAKFQGGKRCPQISFSDSKKNECQ